MAYDDDNERIERMMFGVPYKATTAEARRVWAEVVERAYDDSQITWTFMSFMVLATLLASIAVLF